VRLTPKNPPGRLNRKALGFESDIDLLRLRGHSCRAIHQALLDAGLTVSLSTVKREVARLAKRGPADVVRGPVIPLPREPTAPGPPSTMSLPAFAGDPRSSKEIAQSFVESRPTNRLLRARIAHESSRH